VPDEFVGKVNSDLVGRVVNLASRSARFVEATGLVAAYPNDGGLFARGAATGEAIAAAYEACDYREAMRLCMTLADAANEYVEGKAPWTLKKDPERVLELRQICTVVLNLFHQIAVYLAPVLPDLAAKAGRLLGSKMDRWQLAQTPLLNAPVAKFEHMMARVEIDKVTAMFTPEPSAGTAPKAEAAGRAGPGPQVTREAAQRSNPPAAAPDGDSALAKEPLAAEITVEDLVKVDLRVARIVTAEAIPDAKKLLRLQVSLGGDTTRTVIAGIKGAYEPEQLVGRLVVMVANLAPRKMKFGVSEGMLLAAGTDGEVFLLSPDAGARPGQRLH
jgi:methionyl-tRNA synthetase